MGTKEGTMLYCNCQKPYVEGQFMIECGKCNDWFHGSCVGIEEHQAQDIDVYHCPKCQPIYGPLILKKRRNVSRHNYKEIHEGIKQISVGSIKFIRQLKTRKFFNADDVIIQLENGVRLTVDYLQVNGFNRPILVYEKSGLELVVPPSNFTVYDIEKKVGPMFDLHVIDVARQEDLRMKMREWTEYFNSPVRGKVLNVISLEFSKTSLSDLVIAPELVRNISWVENVWPKEPTEDSPHSMPVVSKYCLMSVKDCYTDFHVDFGGTSVWYHIVRGEKIFYLIEPTATNLKKYDQWVSSSNQVQVFFGDKVEKCYKLVLKPGNTFFIPSGWIHAVLTPKDSLVFGGNFLHSFAIPLQNKIYCMERSLKTPVKFSFANYETTNWYAARTILKKMKEIHAAGYRIPEFLLLGVKEIINALKLWTSKKDEYVKYHKLQVPIEINSLSLIKSLEKELKEDIKLTDDFPHGQLSSPGIMRESKTVLKLKLATSTNIMKHETSLEKQGEISKLVKKKEKLKKKEKKLQGNEGDVKSEMGHSITKRKRGRPRLEQSKDSLQGSADTSNGKKGKVGGGKVTEVADSDLPVERCNTPQMVHATHTENEVTELPIKMKFSLPAKPQSELSSDFLSPSLDKPLSPPDCDDTYCVSPTFEINDNKIPCLTLEHSTNSSSCIDLKAEIEAVKKDLFEGNRQLEDSKLYFKQRDIVDDCTVKPMTFSLNKKTNTKSGLLNADLPTNLSQPEKKPKPKPQSKLTLSTSDSDYDPSDDAYYEDKDFVYPRIDVTSDLAAEDFSWRPGQRKKSIIKRKGPQIEQLASKKIEMFDPFFASDDPKLEEDACIELDDTGEITNEPTKVLDDLKNMREKPKKGFATAKQRLGKLLKLHKTGTRYVR